ncbi:MAG: glutaminyl-peptide cyclotransferase [Flavobacterium nitrogenifigens]|uniref:glutaminyl-peptide cyclotransferase n=1 Tax=Flavobacterium nitrogenifigens TaxID=1617283 RepID=UPI002807CBBC|nr:glutaminyl-peptide cyclotransferase [Flavobacterium nitrogenifigens]MDQ8013222.1 glutaminyl-peptide cyclotransferase [Flavobacterium nitrogenifigens]
MNLKCSLPIFFLFLVCSCDKHRNDSIISKHKITKDKTIIKKEYIIQKTYPHDINSFTEGLFIDHGVVYESTGSPETLPNTKSIFGILDLQTGLINTKAELDKKIFFGEGIAKCGNRIFQLTYKNKTGFIYDSKTYKQLGLFQFDNNEGWGLTNIKDEALIMSDGTNILTFLEPKNLQVIKRLEVRENNMPVSNLNELEYLNGKIYANIYTTNTIAEIDSKTGNILKTIDFSALYNDSKNKNPDSLEMNGIAYNESTKTFLITGKLWPLVYEIKLIN